MSATIRHSYIIFLVCFIVTQMMTSGMSIKPEVQDRHSDNSYRSLTKRTVNNLVTATEMASDSCLQHSMFFRETIQTLVDGELRRLETCMTAERK